MCISSPWPYGNTSPEGVTSWPRPVTAPWAWDNTLRFTGEGMLLLDYHSVPFDHNRPCGGWKSVDGNWSFPSRRRRSAKSRGRRSWEGRKRFCEVYSAVTMTTRENSWAHEAEKSSPEKQPMNLQVRRHLIYGHRFYLLYPCVRFLK